MIQVTFNPRGQRGRWQDRVTFTFEDVSVGEQFTISRLISGSVGTQADMDLLQPSAPYVRRQRGSRDPEGEIVPGERPPALAAIPWKIPLGFYPLPKPLETLLAFGTLEEKTQRIRNLLPQYLTSANYGKHWSTLLHVEEAQLKYVQFVYHHKIHTHRFFQKRLGDI